MSYKNNKMSVAIAILLASTTLSAAKASDAENLKQLDNAPITLATDAVPSEDKT